MDRRSHPRRGDTSSPSPKRNPSDVVNMRPPVPADADTKAPKSSNTLGKKSTNDTLTRKKKLSDTGQRSLLSEYHDYLEANPDPGCCGRDSLLCFLLCGGFGFGGKRPHPSTEIERRRREMMDKLSRLSLGILLVSLLLLLSSTVVSYLGFLLASYYLTHHLGFVSVYYVAVPYCLAAIGILTILCCLYGCCAVLSRHRCHLWSYSASLLPLLLLQLSAVFLANELRTAVESQTFLQADVQSFARRYRNDEAARASWDAIQSTYVCCGGSGSNNGFKLWANLLPQLSVPDSCCLEEIADCGKHLFSLSGPNVRLRIFTRGCMDVIEGTLLAEVAPMLQAYVAGGVAMAFAEGCCAFLACCAAEHLGRMGAREYEVNEEYNYGGGDFDDEEDDAKGGTRDRLVLTQQQQQQQRPRQQSSRVASAML